MEDIANNETPTETQSQFENISSAASKFEEELKRQNISTMLEIYKEEYLEKIEMLTR